MAKTSAATSAEIDILLTPALSMNLAAEENPANPPGTGAFASAQGSLVTSALIGLWICMNIDGYLG
ncbi:MAG: hypothetical protein JXM70_25970 [Pirellulales bacterium]|nr:hypothetical protein [Pirellulales bacterium]